MTITSPPRPSASATCLTSPVQAIVHPEGRLVLGGLVFRAALGYVGVLGWNDAPVQQGRGSAIFLHVARPDYAPTEGCVALALGDLQRVLAAGLTDLLVMPP